MQASLSTLKSVEHPLHNWNAGLIYRLDRDQLHCWNAYRFGASLIECYNEDFYGILSIDCDCPRYSGIVCDQVALGDLMSTA